MLKVPDYLAQLREKEMLAISGDSLELLHGPETNLELAPKDWFRWSTASELTRGVLEKNI